MQSRLIPSTRRHFTTTTARAMPIYVCHCPDYPNALEKRLAVREEHLKRASQDKVDGVSRESPQNLVTT